MSESLRLYRYQSLLSARRAVPTQEFLDALEISLATFKRDIAKMRDQLGMPIVFDRDRGGYVLQGDGASPLPGMWFTPQELVALATIQQLLVQLQPGLLAETLSPLKIRLADLLKKHNIDDQALLERVRIVHAGKRDVLPQSLEAAASATIRRRRLNFVHFNRQTGERVEREVSPQRLVLYRDNWYLDAMCHLRGALRSFSVDAIDAPRVMDQDAIDMSAEEIDAIVYPGYGIFAGIGVFVVLASGTEADFTYEQIVAVIFLVLPLIAMALAIMVIFLVFALKPSRSFYDGNKYVEPVPLAAADEGTTA